MKNGVLFASALALFGISLAFKPAHAVEGTLGELGCPKDNVTIAVLGDSLADGLWGSFFRAFQACKNVDVLRATAVSDGLAKSAPDSWLQRLDGVKPDLVVVSIGANDLVNIRADRTRFVYGEPDWESEYQARVQNLGRDLKSVSETVVWVGLPIVGRQDYEDAYRRISYLQSSAAQTAGIRFVDTHEPTTFGHGTFVMSAEVDGALKQLRHSDLVHFTEVGYDLLAGLIRGDVSRTFEKASREKAIGGFALQ
jgi:hypothetical protein